MPDFRKRIVACVERGPLSVSDLAHWLGSPYYTTSSWVRDLRTARPVTAHRYEARLKLLEGYIRAHKGFPVPFEINSHTRPVYIRRVRNECERKVSRA